MLDPPTAGHLHPHNCNAPDIIAADNLGEFDLNVLIRCLKGKVVRIPKGDPVFLEGDPVRFVGVVLSGTAQVIREDYDGNRSVMTVLTSGDLFAEVFSSCSDSSHFHSLLLKNLLQEMAQKNLLLSQKIRYMSQKTTKEKLMSYLWDQAKQQGSTEFVIPHNRQSLADYLGVERSAMSAEISKLKKSGQIDTHGSRFSLIRSVSHHSL